MKLIVRGHQTKEIAYALDVGEGTIKIQVPALLRKLGVQRRAAVAVADRSVLPHEVARISCRSA
jgi:DNA-binding NarL/FixJ family response regulator